MVQEEKHVRKASWSRQQWMAAGILLLGFQLIMTGVPENSVTMDEPVHALTGYSILKTGDLRLVEDHPPLLEMVMGLPLALDPDLPQPEDLAGWQARDRRAFGYDAVWMVPPIDRWLVPARIPITFFAVLLCAVVFRWVADNSDGFAAVICAALVACDPNFIAHAGLATLDVGVTTLCFFTLYVFSRFLHRPGALRIVAGGLLLGLAIASKVSALPLLPVTVLWMLIRVYQQRWTAKEGMKWVGLYYGIALITVWAVHLFQVQRIPGFPWFMPAPTYWQSLLRIVQHITTEDRYSFLLGRTYRGGVWSYFPVTFILKTPAGLLVLLCLALFGLPKLWRIQKQKLLFLGLYPLIYLTVSLTGAINLGYRHLLPVMPYLYVMLGMTLSTLKHVKWVRILYLAAAIAQMATAIIAWPDYIPYFNIFAGGTSEGYRYLADSSVDWGQGLKYVRTYSESHLLESLRISAFAPFLNPTISYGIQAELLPPQRGAYVPLVLPQRYNPQPGDYIISASTLRGLQVADSEMYNWFWHSEPVAVIAGAMLHYRVNPITPNPSWVAQCTQPVTPLNPQDIAERFGVADLRIVPFDCTQSWIYPGGGRDPGWYVVHWDGLQGVYSFHDGMLDDLALSFEQRIPRESPPHVVYFSESQDFTVANDALPIYAAPGDWLPAQAVEEGNQVTVPVAVGNILSLLRVELQERDQTLALWTTWRVDAVVVAPISLMAHLIDAQNQPLSVGDSLGIPFTVLQPGDIFVQQHFLDRDADDNNKVWIETGVYRLDTLERFPVFDGAPSVGDRFLIPLP